MYQRENDVKALLRCMLNSTDKSVNGGVRCQQIDRDTTLCEVRREVAPGIGIAICGEMDESGEPSKMHPAYYYPYAEGREISSTEYCTLQRHADKETYAGMLDEYRVGVSLIFFLLHPLEYSEREKQGPARCAVKSVRLSALASEGTILLPILKSEKEIEKAKVAAAQRNSLIRAAQEGSTEAMETLTFDEYELYNKVNRRLRSEDVYSIVDNTFMPSGLESDQYQIIGTIEEAGWQKNAISGEEMADILVNCNDIRFRIIVNRSRLLGEPLPGRRFKGRIWMQGCLDYER